MIPFLQRLFFIIPLAFVLLWNVSCDSDTGVANRETNFPSELLLKTWIHSYEEDQQEEAPQDGRSGILTFRPDGYDFPPSRGRVGFTFIKTQTWGIPVFIRYDIGPADGIIPSVGIWEKGLDDDLIYVTIQGEDQRFTIEILELTSNVLRARLSYQDLN